MTLRSYLTIMTIMTSICWAAWGFIILTTDPTTTNWIGFLLFYISLFISIVGFSALVGFLVRFVALKQKLAFHSVKEAFRQSFLFAILVVGSLFLLSYGLFTWLNLGFLVIGLSVLEFFLLSYERK